MATALRAPGALRGAAPLLPAAGLLASWVAWTPNDGGYFARDWYPWAIFLVAMLLAVAIAGGRLLPASAWARVALGLLAAITAWSYLSLLWAETPGSGWAASNQLLLYLATAWLAALLPWRATPAMGLLGLWSVGVGAVCLVELLSALGSPSLAHYILESRWQQPTSYANAAAALPAMAAFGPLMLSARRGLPAPLQVAMLALAAFLVQFSMLPQSRGTLIGLLVSVPVFALMAPDRWRLLARFVVLAIVLAISGDALWDVYGAGEAGRPLGAALDRAAGELLVGVLVAAGAGGALALVERLLRPGPRTVRAARGGAVALAAALALAGGGLAAANAGDLRDYASDRWSEFTSDEELPDHNPARIAQHTSDKRSDYWRVALAAFADAPVTGLGAAGFEREYSKERRPEKPSRAAHSIWMRALADGGIVAAGLLLALTVALAGGLLAARRRVGAPGRGVVAACAGAGVYFLGHASVDWLELLPALAAPAIALPFVALALREDGDGERARVATRSRRARVMAVAAAGVAALARVPPYLSVRYLDRARTHPASADRDLRRAAALNPLSSEPRIAQGTIAIERGRFAAAERAFERALDAEDTWLPHFRLALLHSRAGRFDAAMREAARARALNPPDRLVQRAARLIAERKRIDPRRVRRSTLSLPLYNVPRHE